jgi:MoaA/NifB/PqqE/SkfB family radical SAM enzyme
MTQSKHVCAALWNAFYISEHGDVFSCCAHIKKLGSIYNQKLKDILNDDILLEERKKSLQNNLSCYKNCFIPDRRDRDIVFESDNIKATYQNLKELHITFGERCNIHCKMCWQNHNSPTVLNVDKLIENVDIDPFEEIILQGGETLLIKGALVFLDYLNSKNKKAGILTNGLLIDKLIDKLLFTKYVKISINAATKETYNSIHEGSNWDKVINNIALIKSIRNGNTPQIIGHMTIVKENFHEIPLFIKTFKYLGFESIDFCFDKRIRKYPKGNMKEEILMELKNSNMNLIDITQLKLLDLA